MNKNLPDQVWDDGLHQEVAWALRLRGKNDHFSLIFIRKPGANDPPMSFPPPRRPHSTYSQEGVEGKLQRE